MHPFLGVALGLKRRGHRVTFVVNGYFESLVRTHGLDYRGLGTREDFLTLTECNDLWHPIKSFGYIYQNGIQVVMREHFDLLKHFAQEGPMVGITSALGFGGLIAHEKLGIPMISLHLQPVVLWSDIEPPTFPGLVGPSWLKGMAFRAGEKWVLERAALPTLNAWRRELRLPPVSKITRWWHSPWGVVCLFPEWFAPPQPDWPSNLIQTTFPLWDERTDEPLAADIQDFLAGGEKPIAFTPGSANQFGRPFFSAAVDACERLGRRGLLLTRFTRQLPERLPSTIKHVAYVPFSQLLPHTAALVHHGGIGTTAQAMAAGTPQVIVPQAHDQFDNAARVERMGIGTSLSSRRIHGKRLANRINTLLLSETVTQSCQAIANRMARVDSMETTLDAIEQLSPKANSAAQRTTSP